VAPKLDDGRRVEVTDLFHFFTFSDARSILVAFIGVVIGFCVRFVVSRDQPREKNERRTHQTQQYLTTS